MSNTTIIECIKSRSNVNGKTRWTTQIGDGGIVLNPGDIIEIEGAAINSRGIGADVIEIPEEPVNGVFQNKAYIDLGYYITNRGEDCCPLPQFYQTTWGAEAWNGTGANGASPTGKYDQKYGQLADPDAYSFYYDPLAGAGNSDYIQGHATPSKGDILQSGGFNVVGAGADGRRQNQPGGDPWTPLHRYGNFDGGSGILPATAVAINDINCNRDFFKFKKGGKDQNGALIAGTGGAGLDGMNYHIIRQATNNGRLRELSFNECPWTRLTFRKEISTKSGFKNPSSIAEEITNTLHGAFVNGDTKQLFIPEYANISPKLMFMNTGGTTPAADGDVSCLLPGIAGTPGNGKDVVNGHAGAGDNGGKVADLGTIGGQYLNETSTQFNGPAYITLPANPYGLKEADEGGGGWSCRYIGARDPDRIIAGTNFTTLPRKVGHPDVAYFLHKIKGSQISVNNIAGNTITFGSDKNYSVNRLKNHNLRCGDGNGGEFFVLNILSNTATNANGDTTLVFRNGAYLSAARRTKVQNSLAANGATLTSNKNNIIMNLSAVPAEATKGDSKYSVIVSNIPFTQSDAELLEVPFQFSLLGSNTKLAQLKNYFIDGRKYLSNDTARTAEQIAGDNENWYNELDLGRGLSSKPDWQADGNHLPAPWITDQTAGEGGATTQYLKQRTVHIYSKYDAAIYEKAHLDEGTATAGYFIDKGIQQYGVVSGVSTVNRVATTAEKISSENDIMIVCVKRSAPPNLPVEELDYYAHGTVGFIVKDKNNAVEACPRYNYVGFNSSYCYPGNECVALTNSTRVRNAQGATVAINGSNGTGTPAQKARYNYYKKINTWGQSGFTHDGSNNVVNSVINGDLGVLEYPWFVWMNYINIGSPEIYMDWDNVNNRFSLQKLHKETVITNEKATGTLATPVPVPDAGSPIIEFNKTITRVLPYGATSQDLPEVVSSQAGLCILNVGGYSDSVAGTATQSLDGTGAYELTESNFIGSFWDRLGFSFRDLVGFKGVGANTNPYDASIQGNYAGKIKQNEQLYPITTNAELTTATQASLNIGGGPLDNLGLPMFGLGYYRGWGAFPSQTGAKILARSLPKKLTYPYWLLYSNIVGNAEFFSGDKKKNCLGIITRNYTAGDFAYAFNMNRQFIVQRNTVLTEITQEILNPDFTPADIDDYSVILYKITRRAGPPDESGDPYEQDGLPQKGGKNAGDGAEKRTYK